MTFAPAPHEAISVRVSKTKPAPTKAKPVPQASEGEGSQARRRTRPSTPRSAGGTPPPTLDRPAASAAPLPTGPPAGGTASVPAGGRPARRTLAELDWDRILARVEQVQPSVAPFLAAGRLLSLEDECVMIGYPRTASVALGRLQGTDVQRAIADICSDVIGAPCSGRMSPFTRMMIALRKQSTALREGTFIALDVSDPMLVFERQAGDARMLCIFNLGPEPACWPLLAGGDPKLHVGEVRERAGGVTLGGYSGLLVAL